MLILYFLLFLVSALVLFRSSVALVGKLVWIARYLHWRKFIVAFIFVALVSSIPNLVLGLNAARRGIPQLSLGDVFGGNVVDLTLAVALPVLLARTTIPARGRVIQKSVIFTVLVAILPLLLLLDHELGRGDGLLLLLSFALYVYWIFSKQERFKSVFNKQEDSPWVNFGLFLKNLAGAIFSLLLIILSAEGIIRSAIFFANFFHLPLVAIGILILGPGNALPEIYFAIAAAKKKQKEMILGNLMGSVVVPSTLVLALVTFISPIKISDFSPLMMSRAFLLISSVLFWWMTKTDRRVTRREAFSLLFTYLVFVLLAILSKW